MSEVLWARYAVWCTVHYQAGQTETTAGYSKHHMLLQYICLVFGHQVDVLQASVNNMMWAFAALTPDSIWHEADLGSISLNTKILENMDIQAPTLQFLGTHGGQLL